MSSLVISVLCVLPFLCTHCQAQEPPYVSFNGTTFANHSYLDLTLVGNMDSNKVLCHTSVQTCCSDRQGHHRGDWYFPSGSQLPFVDNDRHAIAQRRTAQRVELVRILINGDVSGIYLCNITTSVEGVREFVYIGLYTSGGDILTGEPLHLQDTNFDALSPQFTLSCTSTGGPATTVTWMRDSERVSDGTSTVLEDTETAEYTHTLTVTGRLGGHYQCIVSNNKPSMASSSLVIQVANHPEDLTLTQNGPMNITISWTPPTPLNYTSGYRVYYKPSDSTSWQNITINDASITTVNVTGLSSGIYYSVSIVGISEHLPSEMRERDIYLAPLPQKPLVRVSNRGTTTLLLSIDSLPEENYQVCVLWEKTYPLCSYTNGSNCITTKTTTFSEYLIEGLNEGSSYTITVTVTNGAGKSISDPLNNEVTLEKAPSAPPENITILNTTLFTITVGWDEVPCIHRNGNIMGYIIVSSIKDMHASFDIIGLQRRATISDLQPDTEYSISVAAVNDAGTGNYSTITASTLKFEVLVLFKTSNTITLTWSEAGSIACDVEISWNRTISSQCPYKAQNNSIISACEQSTTIDGLDEYTTYFIQVCVRNYTLSDAITVTTIESAPSSTPTSLSFIASTASSITIQWEPVPCMHRNGITTGYIIKMTEYDGKGFMYNHTNGELREAKITGLEPSTQYEIQVSAVNSAGIGPFTNTSLIANTSAPPTDHTDTARSQPITTAPSQPTTTTSNSSQSTTEERQPSSNVGGVVAGVIVSLLLVAGVIVGVIAGVCLWRRYRKSSKKMFFPTSHFKVFLRQMSRLHSKDGDDISLKDIPMGESVTPMLDEVAAVTFDPRTTLLESGSSAAYDAPSLPEEETRLIATSFEEKMDTGGVSNVVFPVSDHTYDRMDEEVRDDVKTPVTQLEKNSSEEPIPPKLGPKPFVRSSGRNMNNGSTLTAPSPGAAAHAHDNSMSEEEKAVPATKPPAPLPENPTRLPVAEFGHHVQRYHSNNNQPFHTEFESLKDGEGKSMAIARSPENKKKNRFANISVYDDNRVILEPMEDLTNEYINASYVDGFLVPRKFIAAQGPVPTSTVDFWRMVWQEKVPSIVMITNLMEGKKIKCEQYWPKSGSQDFGPFQVTITQQLTLADYSIRTFSLQLSGKTRTLTHFHYTAWPDHGMPDYGTSMLTFRKRVMRNRKTQRGPLLVHCSAGVGRTGTFITIDYVLDQIEREGVVDITSVIQNLRQQRTKMVQSADQYIFIHDAILESVTCGDTQIEAGNLRRALRKLKTKNKSGQTRLDLQFSLLDQVSTKADEAKVFAALNNAEKNRSTEFLPVDKFRVVLKGENPDYINATSIHGYKQQRAFIITQGPLRLTTRDFWKVVFSRKCSVIVMLSDLVEEEQEVCYQYWPGQKTQSYGEFRVELTNEEKNSGYVLRKFSVQQAAFSQPHHVSQFQITDWTADCRCGDINTLITVIDQMAKVQRRTGNNPIVVHGVDTVSRSAVFCAIATTIERCKTEGVVDVFQVVKAIRIQRPGAIRTMEQYRLVYEALLVFLDSFETYANFVQ